MTVSYALHPIKITGKAGDYQAIIHFTRSVGLEEVIERMIEQNPGLSRPLVQAIVNGYHTAITSLALEGCKINTPTVNHGVSIKGLFDGPGDSFSPDRHHVMPTVSPGQPAHLFGFALKFNPASSGPPSEKSCAGASSRPCWK